MAIIERFHSSLDTLSLMILRHLFVLCFFFTCCRIHDADNLSRALDAAVSARLGAWRAWVWETSTSTVDHFYGV